MKLGPATSETNFSDILELLHRDDGLVNSGVAYPFLFGSGFIFAKFFFRCIISTRRVVQNGGNVDLIIQDIIDRPFAPFFAKRGQRCPLAVEDSRDCPISQSPFGHVVHSTYDGGLVIDSYKVTLLAIFFDDVVRIYTTAGTQTFKDLVEHCLLDLKTEHREHHLGNHPQRHHLHFRDKPTLGIPKLDVVFLSKIVKVHQMLQVAAKAA